MKRLLVLPMVLFSCYCVAQIKATKFKVKAPKGMVYIPSGSFLMQDGETYNSGSTINARTVQLAGFYMDATEVSNVEYREFVNYVCDSMANVLLGNVKEQPDGTKRVVMKKIDWKDPKVLEQLAPLLLAKGQTGEGTVDPGKLQYHYEVYDGKAHKRHPNEPAVRFIISLSISAYPDTTVWQRNLVTFNDPVAHQYFGFNGFNNYPVVGVNLLQCNAFCEWRTRMWHAYRNSAGDAIESRFRLPTEEEWEWAARGGETAVVHFSQPGVGRHTPLMDGQFNSENDKNKYGVRSMKGNVSEWTTSRPAGYENTESDVIFMWQASDKAKPGPNANKYIVRGGNWTNAAMDQPIGERFPYHVDSAAAHIGFRCVYTEVYSGIKK